SQELSARHIQRSPEPPQAFDFPQLYFAHGTEKLSKHYTVSDAIPLKKLEWKVGISPTVEKMEIVVNGISSIPKPVSLFWVTNSGAQDLRENSSINLAPQSESRFGYIVASANPIDIALYTGKFMLKHNFPNPFTKSTVLEFTIPYNWSKTGSKSENDKRTVSLIVYNISGQRVATIHSGKIKVGHHRKVWNGKNNLGHSLPSGIYIARLKSAKFSKTIQMFKVK
ncbi:MAG: FlgD immunoglobulin-like domain containing protein, partial [Chitinispirillia bacterium]